MDSADAMEWLDLAGPEYGVIHELTHDESVELASMALAKGAVSIKVLGEISLDRLQDTNVDWLLIELPDSKEDRAALFDLEKEIAARVGFMPSVDEGQRYIALRFT